MSEMELKAGKAIPIDMPAGLSFEESINHLKRMGFKFDDIELEDEWANCDDLVFANGQWFQLKQLDIDAYGCSHGTLNPDGSIDYICHWYNGGAGFDEVFEQAVNKANGVLD